MANVISWFEIPASDFDRAVTFYSSVFEKTLEETDIYGFPMAFFPNDGEGVTGAIVYTENYTPTPDGTLIYFNANHKINEVLSRVAESDGTIETPKTSLGEEGGFGYIAVFKDTEGNRIGLHSEE